MVDQRDWPTDGGRADFDDGGTARSEITRLEIVDVARMDPGVRELAGVASKRTTDTEIPT